MNHEISLMRDLCDTLMQNYAETFYAGTIEDSIAEFRNELTQEQKIKFNALLDRINVEDSNYAYETFRQVVVFATYVSEYR